MHAPLRHRIWLKLCNLFAHWGLLKCLPRCLNLISFHLHEKRKHIISNSYKLLVRLTVTQTSMSLSQTVFNFSAVRRDRKGSSSTVVTTEIKQTYLYSNKLHSNQRDLASFKITVSPQCIMMPARWPHMWLLSLKWCMEY